MNFYVWIYNLIDLTFTDRHDWPEATKQIEYTAWANVYYPTKSKGADWMITFAWLARVLGHLDYL